VSVDVDLRGFPIDLYLRVQQHSDELFRELGFLDGEPGPLADLLRTVAEVQAEFGELVGPLRSAVHDGLGRGAATVDVTVGRSPEQARSVRRLHELLSGIDDLCVEGVLLSLPLDADALALRAWVVEEVERQVLDGLPARTWAEFRGS
jgi:hypothetical protein